jgi:hypothetical protein
VDDVSIAWLMIIPISGSEFDYLAKNGSDALEELFTANDIDVFNLNRKSVI